MHRDPAATVTPDDLATIVRLVRELGAPSQPASRRPTAILAILVAFLAISLAAPRAAGRRAFLPSSLPPIEESRMRTLRNLGVVSSIAIASAAAAQDAVQWRVEDGGNGNWYQLIEGEMTWTSAKDVALGVGGHLATLTTPSENTFVWALTSATTCFAFLGGYQDLKDARYSEPLGGWKWVTGEPFTAAYWYPGEPNNYVFPENYLAWRGFECTAMWNDVPDSGIEGVPISAVIEWSADCNADGIVDYGQIRAGELDDANGNNIPDCCEAGVPCDSCIAADLDASGAVNGVDLAIILNTWATNGGKYPQADIDGDGTVGGADLALVLGAWGECQ